MRPGTVRAVIIGVIFGAVVGLVLEYGVGLSGWQVIVPVIASCVLGMFAWAAFEDARKTS